MSQFVDLPQLKLIQLGFQSFSQPLYIVFDSIGCEACMILRSSSSAIDFSRRIFPCRNTTQFFLLANHDRCKENESNNVI